MTASRVAWLMSLVVVAAAATVAVAQTPAPVAPAPASAPGATAAVGRIGFIDVQRVLARSVAGVAAREELEREKAGMQKEMDAKRQELEKLRDELEKRGPLMTAEARREKEDTFERRRRDAARLADDFQKELQKKEHALLQKVLKEMHTVIERLGKERGYHLIVERRGLLYADAAADLTDEIIRAYDRESATKGKK